jgi:hypothetical protein
MSFRPPFRTGKTPKERGGHEDLTRGLGEVGEAPTEEIDGEGRSSGSSFRVVRGEAGLGAPYIGGEGKGKGCPRRRGGFRQWPAPLKSGGGGASVGGGCFGR